MSVIVPVYRASEYISAALDSVLAQTVSGLEIIVVNDGSPDTEELERALEPYREWIVYICQENGGPSSARNTGIRAAHGRYIAFLDADDYWQSAYLSSQLSFLEANSGVDLVYADALLIGQSPLAGHTFMETTPSTGEVTFSSLLSGICTVILSGVVVRRQAILDAGLFDETFRRAEDYDLWLRLARNGVRLAYQRQVLLFKRIHQDSLGADLIKLHSAALRVLDKTERNNVLDETEKKALSDQYRRLRCALDLERGKLALARGDFNAAARAIGAVNELQRSAKLRFVLFWLRVSPRILARAYKLITYFSSPGNDFDKRLSLTVRTVWLVFGKTLAFAFSFALPLLLVRRLSQQDFGLYKQVFLVIGTAINILPLGFGMSAFYFLPRGEKHGQIVLNVLLFNGVIGSLACAALIIRPGILAAVFNGSELAEFAPLIAVVILLWVTSSFLEIVAVAHQEPSLATIFIVCAQLSKTTLLLAAAVLTGSVRALLYAAAAQGILQTAILLVYLRSRFHGFWRRFDWETMKSQLSYALPLGIASVILQLQSDLDNYFVSHKFGAASYAVYAIGCFNLPLMMILSESVGSVMIPRVSQLQKVGGHREIIELVARMMRKLSAVYFPVYALLLLTGPQFITILFTSRYLASWPIFAINLTLVPLSIVTSGCDPVLRAYAEHRYYLIKVRIMALAVLVLCLWEGLRLFGMLGAISVVIGVSLIERVVTASKVASILKLRTADFRLFGDIGKLAVATLIAAAVTAAVKTFALGANPFVVFAGSAATLSIVYVASINLLRVLTPGEISIVRRQLGRLRRFRIWDQSVAGEAKP